jgi:hypothetical protein
MSEPFSTCHLTLNLSIFSIISELVFFELLSNEPIRHLSFTLELWTHDWKFIRVYILLDCLANTDLMKGMFALGYCGALSWFYIIKADLALI